MASPVQARMSAHFALAGDLRALAVDGDLTRLRIIAEELATLEETWGMPPGADTYLDDLRAAARRASAAADLDEALRATADVGAACGACHLANDVRSASGHLPRGPLLDDPKTRHARYLSWVSDLLWDGLAGPSDRTWSTGAGAISSADAIPAPHARHVPADEVTRMGERLARIGVDAVTTRDPMDQASILADLWATCTDCHVQAGVSR